MLSVESHDKLSLSIWPSHVVPQGQHVELQCDSHSESYVFKLHKENGDPTSPIPERFFQRSLVLGPITPAYAGIYRCYGFHGQSPNKPAAQSNPLKIIISGIYEKPFLLAPQTPLVNSGEKVILECHSEIMFDTFILTSQRKEIINCYTESHLGGSHAIFSIGPMTSAHAWNYICYGSFNHTPYEWSKSSDPIDIKITGLYKKPSLAALMGPVVMSGENMTLACISDHQFDMFHLSREGVPHGHGQPAVQSHNGAFQANFFLGPVIHKGNYRCYGFFRNSSHMWSSPSDPLYVPVTSKKVSDIYVPADTETDNHKNQNVVIGLSVAMIPVFLIVLLCSCFSAKKSKSREQASERHLHSVRMQDRRNSANMDPESEVRTSLNRQDPERQEIQEVTYTEFDQIIFKQNLTAKVSQFPEEFSTYPSVYMTMSK
ncbi:killer cell immunoglobulin-like receptor 3DL1 [Phodopus roborovskii]|uniref:killer cell immunoglobulin-like receptor 3DL1 n=1 Tax=Phodopus roborovskii TaxID=109678 RepID=UPI0021E3F9B9|nr:killer cell immunoglobulin-like receptor 3DL1 [Phodopus roborovskii]